MRIRKIQWSTEPVSRSSLKQQGFHIIEYAWIKKQVLKSRQTGTSRSSLGNPAEKVLSLFKKHAQIAVFDTRCQHLEDLQIIYSYIMEPAFQKGCTLLVCADRSLARIATKAQTPDGNDQQWRYPWTVERLLDIAERGKNPCPMAVPLPANRWRQMWTKLFPGSDRENEVPVKTRFDPEQLGAINAGDGVVQIIAPAGSGKTTVLIERVKELQKRGTEASRILCMSFNRDATVEIGERLVKAGVDGVVVRSFHGMGLAILKNEGLLRSKIGSLDDVVMEQLIGRAIDQVEPDYEISQRKEFFTISDATNAISTYKLASMLAPEDAMADAENGSDKTKVAAHFFDFYERELARRNTLDFDDLVAKAVTLLQTNQSIRHYWQQKFDRLLVDEYQDIEPSQALLVGILAAPQDSLFCVGDEDQCIYAWRRATVQRIIELDQVYPGLERHALIRNYRCGRRITEASRRLVEHNQLRFRKPLHAGASIKGEIVTVACSNRGDGAELVAHLISDAAREETVVLARTTRLLKEVNAACLKSTGKEALVELATIHASKGREWDRVILFAVDEGQTPHSQAVLEGCIEDERRLFYVAMTRAKSRLEIICTEGVESRFLEEAGLKVNGKVPQF